jgi:hypothetical protein
MYISSLSRRRLSVPLSSTTGSTRRVQPGGGDVDDQLADGDVDAADPLAADAEDAFGVGGHQQVHIFTVQAVVAQRFLHMLWVIDREEYSARAPVFVTVAFDRSRPWGCRRWAAFLLGVAIRRTQLIRRLVYASPPVHISLPQAGCDIDCMPRQCKRIAGHLCGNPRP